MGSLNQALVEWVLMLANFHVQEFHWRQIRSELYAEPRSRTWSISSSSQIEASTLSSCRNPQPSNLPNPSSLSPPLIPKHPFNPFKLCPIPQYLSPHSHAKPPTPIPSSLTSPPDSDARQQAINPMTTSSPLIPSQPFGVAHTPNQWQQAYQPSQHQRWRLLNHLQSQAHSSFSPREIVCYPRPMKSLNPSHHLSLNP
ncbi:hypothetical protein BC829DRAFT_167925 [Chytridium lagenaria]|nr:hypothetical protein BC829DRAFT_167925 [Chytridium lagenaria]